MKKLTAVFGLMVAPLLLVMAACSTDQPLAPMPASHALMPKIALDVQTINLADRSGLQPVKSPYNSNHFAPTIDEAIKQWASDRLQAVGQTGQGIVIIKDAALTAQPLPVQTGIDSWFKRQQAVKYMGHAQVTVEVNGRDGFATADAEASRAVTLPENPTEVEKQDAYYTLLNGLMKDLGQNLEQAIQTHMNHFIITAPILGKTALPSGQTQMAMEQQPQAPVLNGGSNATASLASSPDSFAPANARMVVPLSGPGYQ